MRIFRVILRLRNHNGMQWLEEGRPKPMLGVCWQTSLFGCMVEEVHRNLISKGSCVSITVRLERLGASVTTCPFQMQHATFHTPDKLHLPANEHPPLGLK